MLTLHYALGLFICYFLLFYLYYRSYFRPRVYLILLSERAYMDYYIDRLPHIRERPEERQGMAAFMQEKRQQFVTSVRRFVGIATVAYVVLLFLGA